MYAVGHKNVKLYFGSITPMFLGGFLHFFTRNRNKYYKIYNFTPTVSPH